MTRDRDVLYSERVREYWAAANRREFVVPACPSCEKTFFPPREVCPYCLDDGVVLRESGGVGSVYSFSVVRTDAHPALGSQAPYVVALVALEDGPTLFSRVVDCDPAEVRVGQSVRVAFRELVEGQLYPVFAP